MSTIYLNASLFKLKNILYLSVLGVINKMVKLFVNSTIKQLIYFILLSFPRLEHKTNNYT